MIQAGGRGWIGRVGELSGPLYQRICAAICEAARTGEISPGHQLPPQRHVADLLGCDLTTVTRGYALARAKGVVEGAVGRGTFVRRPVMEGEGPQMDLSMILPPPLAGDLLGRVLREGLDSVLRRRDSSGLMTYHPPGGAPAERRAGAAWFAGAGAAAPPERVVVCPGAQSVLSVLIGQLARDGGELIVAPETYPGALGLARLWGVPVRVCPHDEEGPDLAALENLLAEGSRRWLYATPTLNNPTAATWGIARREGVAELLLRTRSEMIEDDPYFRLADSALPALSDLAPGQVWRVGSLSKVLSPGLRLAYLLAPDEGRAASAAADLHLQAQMPCPLTSALCTQWIADGVAQKLVDAVAEEAQARRSLCARVLPQALGPARTLHLWLPLNEGEDPRAICEAAGRRGLALAASDRFQPDGQGPAGLRLALGPASSRRELADALGALRAVLAADRA